ncbi:MAG: hypothetical protein ACAI38_15185 [Myxococcota bacterium]
MKSKLTRVDSEAMEKGPLPIEKDGLGELLAERAIKTATSGDEPAEYDDEADLDDVDTGDDGSITDEDEDDYDTPSPER